MQGRRNVVAALAAAVLVATGTVAVMTGAVGSRTARAHGVSRTRPGATTTVAPPTVSPPTETTVVAAPETTAAPTTAAPAAAPAPARPAALAGCPVPPHPPVASSPPWHPAVLVPHSQLPPVTAPAPWRSDPGVLAGTGMWVWEWDRTDGGNASAVVKQASAAHLHQLWVRVADSKNGFYGAQELDQLVPAAHAAGLSVIAWGFPYLYDPVGDARWTEQVLSWRAPDGQAVDGFSADIEEASEGVDLTATRVAVYLEEVRRAAGSRPVIATVYPPTGSNWRTGSYPYGAMAPYVDAFAPMIYWECTDPGTDARVDVSRLSTLRPVYTIGQAFNLADVGGRAAAPSAAEITEFLQASRQAGALGASLWVWQDATPQEWAAIAGYRW